MATIRVSNQAQLNSAINLVKSGDTILLASGTYSKLDMLDSRKKDFGFTSEVTIKSENPDKPAVINEMLLRGVSNVSFENVTFDYTGKQAANSPSFTKGKPFTIEGSENVTMTEVKFEGHLVKGFGSGVGLYVKTTKGFSLIDSEMSSFRTAASFYTNEDTTISGNVIRQMNHDGLFFGGMDKLVIENNFIGDYRPEDPSALHKDNIQFHTNGVPASQDVTIRGNTFDSSDHRHGIFMGNEAYRSEGVNDSTVYRNILIEDNHVNTTNLHGITVVQGDGVIVRGNTLTHNKAGGFSQIPQINVSEASVNVQIVENVTDSVQDRQNASWEVHGNMLGLKSRFHFSGIYNEKGQNIQTERASGRQTDPDDPTDYIVSADDFVGASPMVLRHFNFDEGDTLIFEDFASGTFSAKNRGAIISDAGGAIDLETRDAMRSMDYRSDAVWVSRSDDREDLDIHIQHQEFGEVVVKLDDYYL